MKKLVILVCFCLSCISYSIYNPHTDKNITLAQGSASCLSGRTFKQWYAFYGSTTMNTLDSNEFFPSEDYAYKIYEKSTVEDTILSLFLGLFTTISRKTIVVEYCHLNSKVTQKRQETTNPKQNDKPNSNEISEINQKLSKIMERQDSLEKEIASSKNSLPNNTLPRGETEDYQDPFITYMDMINNKLNEAEHRQVQLEDEIRYLKSLPPTEKVTSVVETREPVKNSELQELLKSSEQVILIRGKNQSVAIGPNTPPAVGQSYPVGVTPTLPERSRRERSNKKIASVYFSFNSTRISKKERERIKSLFSQKIKNGTVLLVGYSDSVGSNDYNLKLSKKRAEAVREEIKKLTSLNGDIRISAAGEHSHESIRKSSERRVDIVILDR
ncbi:MAG: OmpA family protein [Leptospiraceae bacterium]|nr:OmpA family protein [Leptospiraceae bacterium]